MEKSVQSTENSKEVCTPAAADPGECGTGDTPIAGEGVSGGKTEVTPAVSVTAPIAEGTCFHFSTIVKEDYAVFCCLF